MWTRGRDKDQPGKFAFELFDDQGATIERVGGFASHTEADRAAEVAQRRALAPILPALDTETDAMSDDELLSELFK